MHSESCWNQVQLVCACVMPSNQGARTMETSTPWQCCTVSSRHQVCLKLSSHLFLHPTYKPHVFASQSYPDVTIAVALLAPPHLCPCAFLDSPRSQAIHVHSCSVFTTTRSSSSWCINQVLKECGIRAFPTGGPCHRLGTAIFGMTQFQE